MSLRVRLALGILALVVLTTLLMWGVSSHGVLRPFARQVFNAFVDQGVYVAERVEAGEDPAQLGKRLGIEVRLIEPGSGPGMGPQRGLGQGYGHRPGWRLRAIEEASRGAGPSGATVLQRDGHVVVVPPGARNQLFVRTRRGWVHVERTLDLDRPQRLLAWFLLGLGAVVLAVAVALAGVATRPLTAAQVGMERIARGDLDHRLDEQGPDEIVRVARAFNHMADRIEGLLRTERELMAGMSHELRTPMSRLRLEVELLREEGASSKRTDAMEGDLTELDALIGQLLQLSRLQLGERTLDRGDCDWNTLVDRALETVDLSRHELVRRGPGGTFSGDADLLLRVAVNLLQNVARYAPAGTRVTVSAEGPRLVVEDEGPGVPEEQLPRLFDPFWRAEGSRARATGGLGLGLMLVRQVVDLHDGEVHAQNRVGGGLRVEVTV